MILLFREHNRISDGLLDTLTKRLPKERRRQAERFRFREGRLHCVAAYFVFRYGFCRIYNQNCLPDFSVAANGKPYLSDFPEIQFNLSHCKGAVCCIFGDSPVGIDVQEIRRLNIPSVKKVCSAAETELIMNSPDPASEFCRIWTVKEALSKLSGDGIFRDIKTLSAENTDAEIMTRFIEPDIYMTAAGCFGTDFTVTELGADELAGLP